MNSILRIALTKHPALVRKRGVVIRQPEAGLLGIVANPVVESADVGERALVGSLAACVIAHRQNGCEYDFDAVSLSEFAYCLEILLDHSQSFGARVSGDFICHCSND